MSDPIEYIESTLVEILGTDAGLTAKIGQRIHPLVLPKNPALPALVYQELDTEARVAADGDTGQRETRLQLSYWAASFSAIKVGKRQLVELLSGYSGGDVKRIAIDAMRDDHEPETGWFRQIVEIVIHWIEE